MARDVAGVEEDARLVSGLVEVRGRCQLLLLVPLVSAIEELNPDKGFAVAGEDPAGFLHLLQCLALEADADRVRVVGAEGAAAQGRDTLEDEDVLMLHTPERVLSTAATTMPDL